MKNDIIFFVEKPKIAWVHTHYRYWTGGTKFIYGLLARLSPDFEITTFVEDYDREIKDKIESGGVTVEKFGLISSDSVFYWLFLPFFLVFETFRLKNRLKKFDLVVSSMFPTNIIVNNLCPEKHIQYVFEPFAFFYNKEMIDGFPPLKRLSLRILKFLYGNIDQRSTHRSKILMTVNEGVARWITKIYKRTSFPSYLGIDTNYFKPTKDQKTDKQFQNKKIIIHATDYTPLKRTKFIIDALPQIVKEVSNSLLVIIHPFDEPGERALLEKRADFLKIRDHVLFAGFVPNEELPVLYSRADLAVYPGIGSGTGAASLFVLEVMACGTPVVRTNVSEEEVIDGETGYLFDPDNKKEMIKKIVALLKNEESARIMGKKARERILDVYTWDKVIVKTKKIFQRILP